MHVYWYQQDLESRFDIALKCADISVRALKISKRVMNALLRYKQNMALGELIFITDEILSVPNLGATGIDELNTCLAAIIGQAERLDDYVDNAAHSQLSADDISESTKLVFSRYEEYMLRKSDLAARILPDRVLRLPLDSLQLPIRAHNALIRHGFSTVADVYDALPETFTNVRNFGVQSREAVSKALACLSDSLDDNGEVNWLHYWQSYGIQIIPEDFATNDSGRLNEIVNVLKWIILRESGERSWTIVQRRYALDGSRRLTLEELGVAFNLTRERVRQLEEKAILALRKVLFVGDFVGKDYRINPDLLVLFSGFVREVESHITQPILQSRLFDLVATEFQMPPGDFGPLGKLLVELLEIDSVGFSRPEIEVIWGRFTSAEKAKYLQGIEQIDHVLTSQTASAMSGVDLLIEVNRNLNRESRLNLDELRDFVSLCSTVEILDSEQFRGRFEFLRTREHHIQRVLMDNGEPMRASELARSINHRLVPLGHPKLDVRNMTNHYLSKSDTFVPIGRSGKWALSEWDHVETRLILDLIEEYLISLNRPASADEIYDHISVQRPVKRASITMYLMERDDFVLIERDKWGLSRWDEARTARIWDTTQVAEYVEAYFRKKKATVLDYGEVKQALMGESGLSAREVQGMLNINPVIKTERVSYKKLLAVFQPDFRTRLSDLKSRFSTKKKTIRQQVHSDVIDLLRQAPGHQLSLIDMRRILAKKYQCSPSTMFTYIAELDYLEEVDIPGYAGKVYTLKNDQSSLGFPQIDEIQNSDLRMKLVRAISFLDVENVDIGLFLLSKEFEATLKDYLVENISNGSINPEPLGQDHSKWKLVSMIDCARNAGIITDHAVFHFLRQKRNDRAHGTMPSLTERQILMRNVNLVAGLYIDYIKLLDALFCAQGQGQSRAADVERHKGLYPR